MNHDLWSKLCNLTIFKRKEKGEREKRIKESAVCEKKIFMAIKLIQLKDLNCRIAKERITLDGFYIR